MALFSVESEAQAGAAHLKGELSLRAVDRAAFQGIEQPCNQIERERGFVRLEAGMDSIWHIVFERLRHIGEQVACEIVWSAR